MFDVECELDYQDDYPALYNDPEFTQYVADTLQSTDLDFDVALTEPQPLQRILPIMLRKDLHHLFMQGRAQKMDIYTRIIIRNLISTKNHC